MDTEKRKREHIRIIKEEDTSSKIRVGFEDVIIMPNSLPELGIEEIDAGIRFIGKELKAPILISSMVGGTHKAARLNALLATAADKYKLAMGVGSQKAMIENSSLSGTYEIRKYAPDILLFGNIGIDYIISNAYDIGRLKSALGKIGADALFVHVNALQEMVQVGGQKDFKNALCSIGVLCKEIEIPVYIKEVGSGMDPETARALEEAGVSGIDIAGSGGTSWALVESYNGSDTGKTFRDWGLPTVTSLILARKTVKIPLIASGGITNGLDVAKSIALGADLAGVAKPFILKAFCGQEALDLEIEKIILELKTSMLLSGVRNIEELKRKKTLIKGETKELLEQIY